MRILHRARHGLSRALLLAMVFTKNSPLRFSNSLHMLDLMDVLHRLRERVRETNVTHYAFCPTQDHGSGYVRRSAAFGVGWATHLVHLQRKRGADATGSGAPAIAIGGCALALAGGAPALLTGDGAGVQALATNGRGRRAGGRGRRRPAGSCGRRRRAGGRTRRRHAGARCRRCTDGRYRRRQAGSRGRLRCAGGRAPRIRAKTPHRNTSHSKGPAFINKSIRGIFYHYYPRLSYVHEAKNL